MIGNDLESLSNWPSRSDERRLRFRRKVYTEIEHHWLCNRLDANYAEVVLWCAKEAVYKALHRYTGERKFAPKKLPIVPINTSNAQSGKFISDSENHSFQGEWWTENDLVHSLAWHSSIDRNSLMYSLHNQSNSGLCSEEQIKDQWGRPWRVEQGIKHPISRSWSGAFCAQLILK